MSGPWFRFGLPLGSALVLAAMLDTVMNLFSAWMDVGDIIIYHSEIETKLDPITVLWILIIIVWILSNLVLLWYGVIIQGRIAMLVAWMVTTLLCTLIILGVWLYILYNTGTSKQRPN